MKFKSYKDLGQDIQNNIHKLQGEGYDLVVGIPRSGMIPAYMIGLLLNVNCTDLNSFLNNASIKSGITRKGARTLNTAWDAEKILLVDDSVMTGRSIRAALEQIKDRTSRQVTRLAIYVERDSIKFIDIFFEIAPGPRVFQWNIFHHPVLGSSYVELEGVLCLEPDRGVIQEEERYRDYLMNAKPLVLPTYKLHTIVTHRSEEYRELTLRWLEKHNIEHDHLIMSDASSTRKAEDFEEYAAQLANHYGSSIARLFFAKKELMARRVAEHSGKPVFCLESSEMCHPGMGSVAKNGKQHLVRVAMRKLRRKFLLMTPDSTKQVMQRFYRKCFR
ncbi:phosphoribosyltransferase family protein [Halomonas korlensis]|uniref:Hypoxanthine phosphoribosyltransferase n=1 Tax=Halomonas korlensis TaxID=463301 RepID=A0A1I7EZH7_9GAMM|nr:phosphoribosyltransferase family protein [Halomonas korlensis]SFU29352.1 Hypoxanthine phosphoribosyltransferase [Halomonas korlensis]